MIWPANPLAAPLAAVVSLLPAVVSYYRVEQPLRVLVPLSRRRLARLVGLTVCIPLVVATAVWGIAIEVWRPRVGPGLTTALATPRGYELGCHYELDPTRAPGVCRWNTADRGLPVYLVGDSNAAQYTDGLIAATARAGRPLAVSTASSCPGWPVAMTHGRPGSFTAACRRYGQATARWLAQARPGVVVMSATDDYWTDPAVGVVLPDGSVTTDPARKRAVLERSLIESIAGLRADGHRVVLLVTLPHWLGAYEWNLSACTLWETVGGCVRSMPLEVSRQHLLVAGAAMTQAARRSGATLGDLTAAVCPRGECRTYRDGRWVYRDAKHVSNAESATLAAELAAVLRRAG